jgi:hypothetical protein
VRTLRLDGESDKDFRERAECSDEIARLFVDAFAMRFHGRDARCGGEGDVDPFGRVGQTRLGASSTGTPTTDLAAAVGRSWLRPASDDGWLPADAPHQQIGPRLAGRGPFLIHREISDQQGCTDLGVQVRRRPARVGVQSPNTHSKLPIPASGEITDARCAATIACRCPHLLGPLCEVMLLTQDG